MWRLVTASKLDRPKTIAHVLKVIVIRLECPVQSSLETLTPLPNIVHEGDNDSILFSSVQVLKELHFCVWALVEHIEGQTPTCPNPAYAPLFYHLGQVHSDAILLRHGAQDVIVQLLVALKSAGAWPYIEIPVKWDTALQVSAPSLRCILLSAVAGDPDTRGFDLSDPSPTRESTGYKVAVQTLRALAPLLQHLLRLSFENKDYITCHQASALLCDALGVECGEIWLDRIGPNTVLAGEAVTKEEALSLVGQIRELMSGPCRGTSEGVLAGEAYVVNQHRLSSSNVFHRVFRDVPQYAGLDEVGGKCIGGENWDKCLTDEQQIAKLQEQGMELTVRSSTSIASGLEDRSSVIIGDVMRK
jgi:hypothetical protein